MSTLLQPNMVLHQRYKVIRLIGRGGMGAVYEATDLTFGSTVALKQRLIDPNMKPHHAAILQTAFEREAKILHLLRHHALPRVTDYFSDRNGQFLVMDYVIGDDLANLLVRKIQHTGQPFDLPQVLDWVDQVLDVLDYLHTQPTPVIHRDIKPHNIKLTPSGKVIVLDLGLAKITDQQETPAPGSASIYAYTLDFAPLEQIQGSGTTPRSDIYSLAMTMHCLLTGHIPADAKPPYDALSRAKTLLFGQPDPLQPIPNIPDEINNVLLQALALNPDCRIGSAAAMRIALRGTQHTQPSFDELTRLLTQTTQRSSASADTVLDESSPPITPPIIHQQSLGQLRSVRQFKGVTELDADSPISCVAFAPDGLTIAFGTIDHLVRVWRIYDETLIHTLQGHDDAVRSIAFSPKGRLLASVGSDKTVRIWHMSDGRLLHTLHGHEGDIRSVAFAADDETLATGSWDKSVRLWRVSDGSLLRVLRKQSNDVFCVAFSPNGQTLAVGTSEKTIQLWRVHDGLLLHTLEGHNNWVWDLSFSNDGQMLASASVDKTVRIWHVQQGTLHQELRGHKAWICCVAFAPNGEVVASGSADQTIRLWRVSNGSTIRTLEGHRGAVISVAFAHNMRTIVSGSADETVRIWKLR